MLSKKMLLFGCYWKDALGKMSYIGAIRSILLYTLSEKMLPERCNQKDARKMLSDVVLNADEKMLSLGAIGKMLPAKCCMLEEKVSLERCFQKDAIGKMLLWALSERCSRKDATDKALL